MSRPFPARFPGKCAGCGDRIHIDDLIRFDGDDVVHEDCDAEPERPERPAVVCETCWLTKPCDCEGTT